MLRRALCGAAALALVTMGWCTMGPPAGAYSEIPSGTASLIWLCQPNQVADPCTTSLAATMITPAGTLHPATWPRSTLASKFDCFYVHPTDSLAKTANTGFAITKLDIIAALDQAAPLSTVCDVWAPAYRSQTWTTVEKFLAGDKAVMASTFAVAYDSVLSAWQWFLGHTQGRPIVLVGDSQGSAVLIHLISAEVDHEPSVLRRLLVAIIVGGNLQVPSGKTIGATFTRVPLCTSGTETGCAIAFSAYPSQPPAGSLFGRPGQGVSLQSGQTAKVGQQVACVNPAALSGSGKPRPVFPHRHPGRAGPVHRIRAQEACPYPLGHLPRPLLDEMQTGWRGHLAPGHQPRGEKPHPAPREPQRSRQPRRYWPGMGLPRL